MFLAYNEFLLACEMAVHEYTEGIDTRYFIILDLLAGQLE
jgi:hypothetical protein